MTAREIGEVKYGTHTCSVAVSKVTFCLEVVEQSTHHRQTIPCRILVGLTPSASLERNREFVSNGSN
jgi:hypothetical protein